MNNAKFSNALVAVADGVQSMASDYEGQIAQLKQHNEQLVKQLAASTKERDRVISIFQNVQGALEDAAQEQKAGHRTDLQLFAQRLLAELEKTPWILPLPNWTPSPGGSPGLPQQPPTSKASTPSASST